MIWTMYLKIFFNDTDTHISHTLTQHWVTWCIARILGYKDTCWSTRLGLTGSRCFDAMRSTKSKPNGDASDAESVQSLTPNPSFRPPVPCIFVTKSGNMGLDEYFLSIVSFNKSRQDINIPPTPILRLLIWMLCLLIDHRGQGQRQRVQPPVPKPDQRTNRWLHAPLLLLAVERAMSPTVPPAVGWCRSCGHGPTIVFFFESTMTNRCQNCFSATMTESMSKQFRLLNPWVIMGPQLWHRR